MQPAPYALLEDEPCPVPDETLGEMYRASARGLSDLIASVPATARALLAVYCYRRAHLTSIGLTIAASCEKDDLEALGGNQGAGLFEQSRNLRPSLAADPRANGRRKITLSTGSLRRNLSPIEDD